jgi:hypothetical protein
MSSKLDIHKLHNPFKESFIKKLQKQVSLGEISFGKMCEILNETAHKYFELKWISVKENPPLPGEEVLVILDYTKWGRKKRVAMATTHFTEVGQRFGGPGSLTGTGILTGLYFALPSICNPEVVTHWMPKPEIK